MRKENKTVMKNIWTVIFTATVFVLAACGGGKKDANASLNDKKAQLEKLKGEARKLEDEVSKLDTSAENSKKVKLVSVAPVATQTFEHYIDLQGKIDADNISYVTPRMGPAQVKAVYVSQGQYVKKGQLLLKLDDAIVRQQIAAANTGMETVKTQLAYAKNIYQRQKNLWDQGIGTEVQLITAKNSVESLENQLKTAAETVKISVAQQNTSNVYSDVNGIADVVNIKVGEIFSGGQIKIVNTSSLKIVTNIPENYLTRVNRGMPVTIEIPDAGKKVNSAISLISQSIDPLQRGFIAEARIPSDGLLKPNQIAIMKIRDYSASNAVVIPVNVVQSDEKGKYVYVLTKSGNGKTIASKRNIIVGETYGELVEIKAGIAANEQLITAGYQNLYEGQLITVQ